MRKRSFIVILFTLQITFTEAQSFFSPTAWRTLRREVGISFGASNFLGDLGGRDAIGTNFLRDWEFSMIRFSSQVYHSYYLNQSTTIKTNFSYAWIQGDDKLTKETFRSNRNLNFKSNVYEFSTAIQWLFLKEKMGNKYGLRNIRHRKIGVRANSIGMYLTAGIGVMYFNPKGNFQGRWVELHRLHTEGQGLPGGPRQYKRVGVSIPLGIGFRKSLSRQSGLYLEFTQHYTFTDYLDDVSSSYYDNAAISQNFGTTAAAMADPNLGQIVDVNGYSYVSAPGEQRGDIDDKDNFMMLTLGYYYKIRTSNTPYGRGSRKRRVKSLL
ncbi:MAG: DUF6089 family protein [Flavobacteriales bacterium]